MSAELEAAIVAINPDLEGRLATDLAEKLHEQGWARVNDDEFIHQAQSISDFREDSRVEVFWPLTGEWLPGFVSAIDHGFVHVETVKGPTSVASLHRIRWPRVQE